MSVWPPLTGFGGSYTENDRAPTRNGSGASLPDGCLLRLSIQIISSALSVNEHWPGTELYQRS
ncbi:hypothetical protein ACU686_32230 [Yinghuangia aomiensis]